MHSRGSTEQYLCTLDPHCGYLLKVKKVSWCPLIEEDHRLAIILENVLVPLIKEGQLSHKYAIASPVESMNLVSKGPNKSSPNIDPPYGKMSWYPHAIKLLQKWVIFNEAINLHSRGPTEQHLYVLEPHRGCLHNLKKCPGTPSLKRANRAINMHSRGPTGPSKWKMS